MPGERWSYCGMAQVNLDHGCDFDLEFLRINIEFAVSQEKCLISMKQEMNIFIDYQDSNVVNNFDLGNDLS